MEIEDKYKSGIKLLNKDDIISAPTLEKLLENCGSALAGGEEIHDLAQFHVDHDLEMKQLYAALLYIFTQFVRNNQSGEDFLNFLTTDCNIDKNKAEILERSYEKWFRPIRTCLLNIGSHLPHIVDVRWRINNVVKSNSLDRSDGPMFIISLKTEKYDTDLQGPRTDFVEFTCTSQELQDLVYKLKDAVRHCQRLAAANH